MGSITILTNSLYGENILFCSCNFLKELKIKHHTVTLANFNNAGAEIKFTYTVAIAKFKVGPIGFLYVATSGTTAHDTLATAFHKLQTSFATFATSFHKLRASLAILLQLHSIRTSSQST